MKIVPMGAAPQSAPTPTSSATDSARARAIAMVSGQQPQQSAVQNQNAIAPEEMGALSIPKPNIQASSGQEDVSVDTTPDAPAPKAVPTAEEQEASKRYAQLARQEKAARVRIQQQEQALKAKEQALAAREAELATKDGQYKSDYVQRASLKQDPLAVLAEAGISYEELTQQILNEQPRNARTDAHIGRLEAKIQELERQSQEGRKAQEQSQQQAYQAAVKQIATDAKKLVYTDPTFETIKATNSVSDVVELITRTYDKDGIVMSVEEAAQAVEDYLVEEAMKITQIDKIKKRMSANAQAPVAKEASKDTQQTQPTMKTLTNSNTTQRKLTNRERAIAAMEGRLKT